ASTRTAGSGQRMTSPSSASRPTRPTTSLRCNGRLDRSRLRSTPRASCTRRWDVRSYAPSPTHSPKPGFLPTSAAGYLNYGCSKRSTAPRTTFGLLDARSHAERPWTRTTVLAPANGTVARSEVRRYSVEFELANHTPTPAQDRSEVADVD